VRRRDMPQIMRAIGRAIFDYAANKIIKSRDEKNEMLKPI